MSPTASTSDGAASIEHQQLLSHLVQQQFDKLGGAVPLEMLHYRATDYEDLVNSDITSLIEEGEADGIYQIDRANGGARRITAVDPTGECPSVLEAHTSTAESPPSFDTIEGIGETTAERLRNEGFESFEDLYAADPTGLTEIPSVTTAKAQDIIEQAGQFVPPTHHLFQDALNRYRSQGQQESHGAIVQDIIDVDQDVGDPLALADPTLPTEETHYHGLPVLTDIDHPHMVRATAFPCDDGTPISPVGTEMATVGLDTVTATTQKLAKGNMGLRLVGPHGCGKNYTLKYINYKTNRVLVSIDADSSMLAQDVLGVSTVTDDQVVAFRDGVLTKAMKHGYTIVVNEANVAPPGVMMALQEVLNQNVLTVKESGEKIIPHPAARIVITMNPPTREYRGNEPLNAATRDRFQTIYFDYLDPEDEVDLLDQLANTVRHRVDREGIRRMVEVANATRDNETWPTLSTRKLEHAIDWVAEGASVRGALKHVVRAAAEPHHSPVDTHDVIEDT